MGGWASGRYGGGPTADAAYRIDLAWMMRKGYAKEGCHITGTLSWNRNGEPSGWISYTAIMDQPGEERLELSYYRGEGENRESIRQVVRLTFTRPHYGGKRWWMICPYRHIRVGKLYLPSGGDRFAGRKAWRLGYQIQRVAHRDRSLEALFALQKKLGCPLGVGNWPTRPKGMWQRTFDRHMKRYDELDYLVTLNMVALVARLGGRTSNR